MKKILIVINGTMGVGKSTVAEALKNELENSVMLDGDWCWMMNPWRISEENKKMVEKNIVYILNGFLNNPSFEYIIFTWVLHRENILTKLLSRIEQNFRLLFFTLTCEENELIKRMKNDNRDEDNIKNALGRIDLYKIQNSIKIDTTLKDVIKVVTEIKDRILSS